VTTTTPSPRRVLSLLLLLPILCCLVSPNLVLAQLAPGEVRIVVQQASDAAPIAGAIVRLGGRVALTNSAGAAILDGVPTGDYPLSVEKHGYDLVETNVVLAPGAREPIETTLVATITVPIEGTVTLADGRPVAGAQLRFAATKVVSGVAVRCAFVADWQGRFSILELPIGDYMVVVSAPGCHDLTQDITVETEPEPLQFTLEPTLEATSVRVQVLDAVTGGAVSSAQITLAEAWPEGVIAAGTTGANGMVTFANVTLGQLNWLADDDTVAATTGRATLRLEAEGYEPRTVPLPYRPVGAVAVKLNPTAVIEENEPNNDIASAQPIRLGTPVQFSIPENGDNDHFRFRLEHPGHVRIAIGPANPVWLNVHLLNANGDRLRSHSATAGNDLVFDAILPAGEYILQAHQFYNNDSSQDSMTLLVSRTTAADPFEPNDTIGAARPIRFGEEVRGWIFPLGDHDHYEFAMKRPGIVRLTMPPVDVWRHVSIRTADDVELAATNANDNVPLELVRQLQPGRYTIRVRQFYDNRVSTNPYSLRLEVMEDDSIDDPREAENVRLRAVRTLELGDIAGASIHPAGDVDRYALSLPEPGVLHARLYGAVWGRLRLRTPEGTILTEASANVDTACELTWHCQQAQGVLLEVRQFYDNRSDGRACLVSTWWEPADEGDAFARNDDLAGAVPWNLGEPLRGSISPMGDNDLYQIAVEHPGYLHLEGVSPVWWRARLLNADGEYVSEMTANPDQPNSLVTPVLPGDYFIALSQFYNNRTAELPYELHTRLERAEMVERVPLADDPPRLLRLGEAQPFKIEQNGDRDRFLFDIPGEGPFFIRFRPTVWTRLRLFDDAKNEQVFETSTNPNQDCLCELAAERPSRYRAEFTQYYNNRASMEPGWIIVDTQDRPLVGAKLDVAVEPTDPTQAVFTLTPIEGFTAPARASVDADGDGNTDFDLTPGSKATHRYPGQGHYAATARLTGPEGTTSLARAWVPAVGPQPREGVQVSVRHPAEGASVESAEPCRVRAISYTGAPVRRVDFAFDGRTIATAYSKPFEADLPWQALGAGEHVLTVTARDGQGNEGIVERTITRSEYFGLTPDNGTIITGDDVAVRWLGTQFGRAAVRYREVDTEEWTTQEGQRATDRRVVLRDLEPDRQYEFQPLGAGEPGPIRLVKRVRGLAFGRDRYAGTIQRDYDQRLGVSVRNNGDEPMRVKLACGKPPAATGLLAGFVGEGSEGAPIPLEPGEEREFMLGLSAQDVIEPTISFPIRITSDTGYADEAEVAVNVILPEVKLRWEELESENPGMGLEVILHNDGDGLTDLSLRSDSPDFTVSPAIDHGIFPAGDKIHLKIQPRLYEGFSSAAGTIIASAVGESVSHDASVELPEGMQVHGVQLIAGAGALDEESSYEANLLAARAMAGAYLNPNSIDWSQWSDPVDSDENGQLDRWSIRDDLEGILWVGDDTDGDGEIDFVHADIGDDGQYDYSAFRIDDGWEETNLVEAYLEMGFSLPWSRSSYEKHDVDVVMNGVVVASLRDQVPEGNYTFRLPPTVIKFNEDGEPEGNQIGIKSKHLRGGHYVVSSDFRIKTRLTGTRVWVVADSAEAARAQVVDDEDLTLEGPDYSVSSAELEMRGQPIQGATLEFLAPIRNVGASRTAAVAVALQKYLGGGKTLELGRVYLEEVPLTGTSVARIPWIASAGNHTLWLVVDPDDEIGDTNVDNNKAVIACSVPGDEAPPIVTFQSPADGAEFGDSIVAVEVEATDDTAVVQVNLSVDGGIPAELAALPAANRYAGQVLLQPGGHTLKATVIDGGGNTARASIRVNIDAPAPTINISSPGEGAAIDDRQVTVTVEAEGEPELIAGRVNGGPWVTGKAADGRGEIDLQLEYGPAEIEVMAVNDRGVRGTDSRSVTCTAQPEDEDEDKDKPEDEEKDKDAGDGDKPVVGGDANDTKPDGKIDVDGVGEVDALGPPNAPIKTPDSARGKPKSPTTGEGPEPGSAPPSTPAGDSPPVGSAPATEAQPETLPPVTDPTPVDPEEEADAEPEDDTEDAEQPTGAEEGEGIDEGDPNAGAPHRPATHRRAPRRSTRPVGGFIGAKAQKSDWYCTNRPEVNLKFRLPDELKRKKLPKPGTPEFDAMMTRLLTDMRMRGFSMNKLEQFHKSLLRRIKGMNQPGELPGFLESFNIVGPKPNDPAKLKAWRENMENTANAWFLRLLSSGDPNLVAQGLKARAEAIGQFDKAMQDAAEGAITEIEGNQKLVETCAEALPVVGEMADVYAFVTGESALSGERLSALERIIRIAGVIGPFGLEQLVKRSPNAQLILQGLGEMGESMGKSGKNMLAKALGKNIDEVDNAFAAVGKFLTKERKLVGETMEDKMAREARLFAKSPEGIADATRRLKDHAEARDLVNKLKNASPDSDDYARAVRELQSNKTAQALINRADVPDALRRDVNGHIRQWYDAADEGVADGFQSLYRGSPDADQVARTAERMGLTPSQAEDFQQQVADFCKKHNVDPDDVCVDTLTITNRRPPQPGEVPRTSVGRDRDVTFQIQAPMRDPNTGEILIDSVTGRPRMIGEDIHHGMSKDVYDRQFWQSSGQGDLPRLDNGDIDTAAVSRYAEDTMDQTVTSAAHNEAYNTGEVLLDDFLDKGITPNITRIDDVCDTVSYKSTHWFGKADDASAAGDLVMASRNTAEGMRQATKQYDDLVLSRVRQYGLDPNVHVPPRLKASMDVFRQVKDGAVTPAKAEAMLKAIGSSKEQAVREMSGFLNGLEKTTGVGWRRIKSAELVNNLAGIQKAGGAGWQDDAIGAINDALRNGHISGSQFNKLRANVGTEVINAVKVKYPSQWKQHLRDWAAQAYQRRLISAAERAAFDRESE
jgi:Carboxypeptidase regulatory-like domain/Bacterial Ig domain/Pre-toxin TG